MIRLNAIMGNVDLCKSIEEAFKVEYKNSGKLLFDDITVTRNEKIPKPEHKINGVHWKGNVTKKKSSKSIVINWIWLKTWIEVWHRENTKVVYQRILMERVQGSNTLLYGCTYQCFSTAKYFLQ